MSDIVKNIYRGFLFVMEELGYHLILLGQTVGYYRDIPKRHKILLRQIELYAIGGFSVAIIVGVFTGMLTDPYFKIHGTSAEGLRGEIEEALTAARAGYEKEQAPRRIAAAEIRADIDEAILLRDVAQYREACAALSRAQTRARIAKMRSLFDEAGDMIDVINQLE